MSAKLEGPLKVEVQADTTDTWTSNALRFDSVEEASAYAADLWSRWTAVRRWRVVNVADGAVLVEQ